MELTSLGRAYLAGIPDADRNKLIAQFRRRNAAATRALIAEVTSIRSVRRDGYCAVSWQPGVLAVATPIVLDGCPVYALNMSMQDIEPTPPSAQNSADTSWFLPRDARKSSLNHGTLRLKHIRSRHGRCDSISDFQLRQRTIPL
ncbi:hypothetical protein [Bradyrhizobium japonicum]|uniref:hypothetical protein n=1 Tax=Bradyrhizobium japonicum TaxID=375 RepID=UPI0004BBEC5B|nr:hypothetical protein [Bradyrhizobium japonicum]